jgi:hypothetical protein
MLLLCRWGYQLLELLLLLLLLFEGRPEKK